MNGTLPAQGVFDDGALPTKRQSLIITVAIHRFGYWFEGSFHGKDFDANWKGNHKVVFVIVCYVPVSRIRNARNLFSAASVHCLYGNGLEILRGIWHQRKEG